MFIYLFIYLFIFERKISEMRGPTGVKFCTMVSYSISDDLEVRRRISPKWMKIFKIGFLFLYSDSSCVRRNKSGEVWSCDLGDLNVKSYPPKAHFSEERISAHRGCRAPKFLHALENDQVLLAHSPPGTETPLLLFSKWSEKLA